MPERVEVEFVGNEKDLLADAILIQSKMDKLDKTLKDLGLSSAAYSQAVRKQEQAQRAAAQATDEQTKANQKEKISFTELNNAISLAGQGLQKLKQAYDFARQGAQIEFTAIKFDRLAQSIGTTGEALMGEMKDATRGTLSDMQLMASATDIVGLGLVKTGDDAVRLAKVMSGLGMDVGQVTLALANQTTMRFDQLGVSVMGFDERLKALKDSGMDANSAFTEAFLQQAEQQLLKVGNAADTSLGSFMKLEAQTQNLTNSLKVMAGNILGPAVDALAKSGQMADHYRDVLQDVNPELAKQYNTTGRLTGEMRALVAEHDRLSGMAKFAAEMLAAENTVLVNNTDIVKANTEASKAYNDALKVQSDGNKQYLSDLERVAAMNKKYNDGLAEADAALAAGKMTAEEHASAVANLAAEYDSASKKIVASMLEMKYMADGVFTDQEMNSYISGLERLGIITAQDAATTRELMTEANLLTPAFSSASKGAQKFDEKLVNVDGRMNDVTNSADGTSEGIQGIGEASQDAHGPLSSVAMDLGKLPPTGTEWNYGISINVSGSVPKISPNQIQGGTCFTGDTLVQMADGATKPIREVRTGDVVLSYDLTSKRHINAVVVETFEHPAEEVADLLKINDLKVTAEHLLWIGDKWRPAGDLWLGAPLLNIDGGIEDVTNIEHIEAEPVYNLHTNHPSHNYFAGGYLAHNAKSEGAYTGGQLAGYRAGGGPLGSSGNGLVVVGDMPGGKLTAWSEAIDTRTGWVYNARDTRELARMGYLDGAASRSISGPLEHDPGIPSRAPKPTGGVGPSVPHINTSGRVGSGRGGLSALGGGMAGMSAEAAAASVGTQAAQISAMTAAMNAQAASQDETNKLLRAILGKTGSANDIGAAVSQASATYK